MNLAISSELVFLFPELKIGVLCARGLDNKKNTTAAYQILAEEVAKIKSGLTVEMLETLPEIVAWRETYSVLNQKPKRNRPSAENLIRYVLKSGTLDSISPVVDIYLAAQLCYLLPIGGYDLDAVEGDIALRRSAGNEPFLALGKTSEEQTEMTDAGEVVYADSNKVLTRRWNWRDGDLAKITADSRNIVLMAEVPSSSISSEKLERVMAFMASCLQNVCGGQISTEIWEPSRSAVFPLK